MKVWTLRFLAILGSNYTLMHTISNKNGILSYITAKTSTLKICTSWISHFLDYAIQWRGEEKKKSLLKNSWPSRRQQCIFWQNILWLIHLNDMAVYGGLLQFLFIISYIDENGTIMHSLQCKKVYLMWTSCVSVIKHLHLNLKYCNF